MSEEAPVREVLATFGHHPDPSTDFCCEVELLDGWLYDVQTGMRSQWRFWGRLSRLLKFCREHDRSEFDDIAQRAWPSVFTYEQKLLAS